MDWPKKSKLFAYHELNWSGFSDAALTKVRGLGPHVLARMKAPQVSFAGSQNGAGCVFRSRKPQGKPPFVSIFVEATPSILWFLMGNQRDTHCFGEFP